MEDPLDRLADTRDAMDRATQRFERAAEARREATGADATGEVTVRMAPDGRLADVVLGSRWTLRLDPASFGAAVLEAYAQASLDATLQWGRALAETFDDPEPATRPLPPVADSTYARLDDVVSSEELGRRSAPALEALAEMLRSVNRDLDSVSAEAEAVAAARHTATSRQVEVTVSGTGLLLAVDADPDWAASTNAATLAQHTMRAYADARRLASARTVDDVVAQSSLGELNRLAADPAALAARLGLT